MSFNFGSIWNGEALYQLQKLADKVENYGKSIQDLVAEGQLTPEQFSDLITTVNGLVKSGEISKFDLSEALKVEVDKINEKADKNYVDAQFNAILDGSPKGAFETVSALESEYPDGTDGVYVVTADGNWYYYDGASWTPGGVYQSTLWQNALTIQDQTWSVI